MKKSQYWQTVRGICILAVIMIHCPTGQNYAAQDYRMWIVLRQIINFPVALFIFMAGYFIKRERILDNGWKYLTNRGGSMLYQPYLIWSSIYLIKSILLGNISWKYIIYALVTGKAATPLYYIIVLLQLTILTPWLIRFKNRKLLYCITPVYLILIYVYNIVNGSLPLFYETFFPAWLFFFLFGIGCREGKFDVLAKKINFNLVMVMLMASFGETHLLLRIGCADEFAASQITFSSFLYVTVIALWLLKNERNIKENWISKIGDISYGIFYSHMLVLWIVKKILVIVGVNDNWGAYFILTFIFTALGSICMVSVVRFVFKKIGCEKALRYIGF